MILCDNSGCRRFLYFFSMRCAAASGILLSSITAGESVADELPRLAGRAEAGMHQLNILAPDLLELELVQQKEPDPDQLPLWNFKESDFNDMLNSLDVVVRVDGRAVPVQAAGFKRRVAHAPLNRR